MKTIALEVFVNGERQYTVGSENWQFINAGVFGYHIGPEPFGKRMNEDSPDLPTDTLNHLQIHAAVAVSNQGVEAACLEGEAHKKPRNGRYPSIGLSTGDEIRIRVVETDSPDSPEWQADDPRFPGQTVVLPESDSE